MRLSPSAISKYDECPKAYYYSYVEGWRPEKTPVNLAFGTAMHKAIEGYLLAETQGQQDNIADRFAQVWEETKAESEIGYGKQADEKMTPEDVTAMGIALAANFPAAWEATGMTVAMDEQGPMIERYIRYEIAPGVECSMKIDLVALDTDGNSVVVDHKTPAAPSTDQFLENTEQLTLYVDGSRRALKLPELPKAGFLELVKRKVSKTGRGTGPFVQPFTAVSRTEDQIKALHQKVIWMTEDIAKGRFPSRPRIAFNSPCNMCEFYELCTKNDSSGLVKGAAHDNHQDALF